MTREWGAFLFVNKASNALMRAGAAVLLLGTFLFAGPALAQPDPCPTGQLGMGTGQDIVINKRCNVGSGSYNYGNVNIIAGGSLVFQELIPNVKIDFWASSILVENGGGLFAGADPAPTPRRRRLAAWEACSPFIFTAPTRALAGRGFSASLR